MQNCQLFRRRAVKISIFMGLLLAAVFFSGRAWADPEPVAAGTIEAQVGDHIINFPTLRSDYQAEVEGDLVTVTLTQTFANPLNRALNATYLFPLPTKAAVYKMEMEVGDERIEAKIQRVEEARATYEQAKSEGRAAALLTQRRPNMFTQEIANLMPGLPVKVTISYVQVATKVDGRYELVVPLVVGPRYQPAGSGEESGGPGKAESITPKDELKPESISEKRARTTGADGAPPISVDESRQSPPDSSKKYGVWEMESLPAYPPVSGLTIPKIIDEDRVGLVINLKAGQPIVQVNSATHILAEKKIFDGHINLSLAKGRTIDNCDFILNWSLSGEKTEAGLLAHKDERGGFFSLLIEPPAVPQEAATVPREMVFVLDTSGSMSGAPLIASQKFMRQALKTLRPGDYFRIVAFDNAAREFSNGEVPANPKNIQSGLDYVNRLQANGGTEAAAGIKQAFGPAQQPGTLRLVVFLTDGYIGNEAQVLALINELIGKARILTFGVGTSVNRYLLEEAAIVGRGWCRVLDPTSNVDEVVTSMAGRLEFPVLTDIEIDWGGEVEEAAPNPVPDLFAGQSVRVMGRYIKGGAREVAISGFSGGKRATMRLKIDLPESPTAQSSQAIPLIWARENIADLQRRLTAGGRNAGEDSDALKERITIMGLTYNLVTQWTSFVAVSNKVVNTTGQADDAKVPLPQVKGIGAAAYGLPAASYSGPNFSGGGVPEPATMGGLALMAAAGWAALRRRRR